MKTLFITAAFLLGLALPASSNSYVWAVIGTESSGDQILAHYSLTGTDQNDHTKTMSDTIVVLTSSPSVSDVQTALGADGVAAEQASMDAWLAKLYPGN